MADCEITDFLYALNDSTHVHSTLDIKIFHRWNNDVHYGDDGGRC